MDSFKRTEKDPPVLSIEKIKHHLKTDTLGEKLTVFESLESTNHTAKERAQKELVHGEVIIALEQTNGKGRLGRQWTSSAEKAIAMSLILSPGHSFSKPYLLTQMTAAALSNTLSQELEPRIKWPNDILVNNKKAAGILTEALYSGSSLDAIIIGIGLNVNQLASDFPEELLHKATSLRIEKKQPVDPSPLVASFLNEFERLYQLYEQTSDSDVFLSICRQQSAIIGKTVWVHLGEEKRKARVSTIGENGELLVTYLDTDEKDKLHAGEISIRGLDRYI